MIKWDELFLAALIVTTLGCYDGRERSISDSDDTLVPDEGIYEISKDSGTEVEGDASGGADPNDVNARSNPDEADAGARPGEADAESSLPDTSVEPFSFGAREVLDLEVELKDPDRAYFSEQTSPIFIQLVLEQKDGEVTGQARYVSPEATDPVAASVDVTGSWRNDELTLSLPEMPIVDVNEMSQPPLTLVRLDLDDLVLVARDSESLEGRFNGEAMTQQLDVGYRFTVVGEGIARRDKTPPRLRISTNDVAALDPLQITLSEPILAAGLTVRATCEGETFEVVVEFESDSNSTLVTSFAIIPVGFWPACEMNLHFDSMVDQAGFRTDRIVEVTGRVPLPATDDLGFEDPELASWVLSKSCSSVEQRTVREPFFGAPDQTVLPVQGERLLSCGCGFSIQGYIEDVPEDAEFLLQVATTAAGGYQNLLIVRLLTPEGIALEHRGIPEYDQQSEPTLDFWPIRLDLSELAHEFVWIELTYGQLEPGSLGLPDVSSICGSGPLPNYGFFVDAFELIDSK